MAVQLRRGAYPNLDKSKLVPGEFAIVRSGDSNTTSGRAVYICYNAGDVERLVAAGELEAMFAKFVSEAVMNVTDKVTETGNQILSDLATNYPNYSALANRVAELENSTIDTDRIDAIFA